MERRLVFGADCGFGATSDGRDDASPSARDGSCRRAAVAGPRVARGCSGPITAACSFNYYYYFSPKSKSLIWRPKHISKHANFGMLISRGVNLGILGFVDVGGSKWLGHAP